MLATKDVMRLRKPELHNDASKKVMTQQAPPSPRPQRSRVFTRSPNAERVTTTMPPKRVTKPACVAVIGAAALGFRPKKPSPHLVPHTTSHPRTELVPHDLGTDHAEASLTPGDPDARSSPPAWPKEYDHHHRHVARRQAVCAVHLLGPPPRHPQTRTHVARSTA
jgi:hypothetical protein